MGSCYSVTIKNNIPYMTYLRSSLLLAACLFLFSGTTNAQSKRDRKDDISYRQKDFKNGHEYGEPKPNGPSEKRLKKYQEKKSKWRLPDADTTSK
jgi:hypothetical protein